MCKRVAGYAGEAADVWSVGVCLFGMLCGFFPLPLPLFVGDNSDLHFHYVVEAVSPPLDFFRRSPSLTSVASGQSAKYSLPSLRYVC